MVIIITETLNYIDTFRLLPTVFPKIRWRPSSLQVHSKYLNTKLQIIDSVFLLGKMLPQDLASILGAFVVLSSASTVPMEGSGNSLSTTLTVSVTGSVSLAGLHPDQSYVHSSATGDLPTQETSKDIECTPGIMKDILALGTSMLDKFPSELPIDLAEAWPKFKEDLKILTEYLRKPEQGEFKREDDTKVIKAAKRGAKSMKEFYDTTSDENKLRMNQVCQEYMPKQHGDKGQNCEKHLDFLQQCLDSELFSKQSEDTTVWAVCHIILLVLFIPGAICFGQLVAGAAELAEHERRRPENNVSHLGQSSRRSF